MPLLQYGLYTGKVGAGAYGTGECGAAAADAAGIIAVVGVAAVPVDLPRQWRYRG